MALVHNIQRRPLQLHLHSLSEEGQACYLGLVSQRLGPDFEAAAFSPASMAQDKFCAEVISLDCCVVAYIGIALRLNSFGETVRSGLMEPRASKKPATDQEERQPLEILPSVNTDIIDAPPFITGDYYALTIAKS